LEVNFVLKTDLTLNIDFLKIDESYTENEEPVVMNYSAYNSPKTGDDTTVNVLKVEK
jgi:hypothetical protein